jgi:hypothetical protein
MFIYVQNTVDCAKSLEKFYLRRKVKHSHENEMKMNKNGGPLRPLRKRKPLDLAGGRHTQRSFVTALHCHLSLGPTTAPFFCPKAARGR